MTTESAAGLVAMECCSAIFVVGDLSLIGLNYKGRERPYALGMDTLTDVLKWGASISGIIAALMVSLDLGRRVTGWGFVLFVASSICWISGAALTGDWALGTQNVALFGINLLGVYRYLIRKKGV